MVDASGLGSRPRCSVELALSLTWEQPNRGRYDRGDAVGSELGVAVFIFTCDSIFEPDVERGSRCTSFGDVADFL